jgi:hypothetical protein
MQPIDYYCLLVAFRPAERNATGKQYLTYYYANDSGPGDAARATLREAMLTIGQVPPVQMLAEQRTGFVELPRAPSWYSDVG